jgi:hypothetical protein
MRPAWLLTGMACLLATGIPAPAQNVLYTAVVSAQEAEVRCRPGLDPKLYPTNRLFHGESVQVLEVREDGWLAIKPPRSSFSWINLRFLVKLAPLQWSVENDVPVPVFYGSELINAQPTVESVRVTRGTIVVSVGEPQVTGEVLQSGLDGKWLPIEPPPTERRYIRADAVERVPFVQTASSKPSSTPYATPAPPLASPATASPYGTATPSGGSVDPLWFQAQRAEQEGKIEEAEQLYTQLAGQTLNHDLAIACQNRIRSLYELKRNPGNGSLSPARLTNAYPLNSSIDSRLVAAPPNANAQVMMSAPAAPTPGRAISQYTYARDVPAAAGPPAAVNVGSSPALGLTPGRSGPCWLRRTGNLFLDDRPLFALEKVRGQLTMYVTAEPGVNLEAYVGKQVELFGPIMYRGDLKTNYMTVTQVAPLP